MKNCTGILCPMQFGTVDPATCQAVDYCPQATPPKTNADRIRSMTDEELAEYLYSRGNDSEYCYGICAFQDECKEWKSREFCIEHIVEWLKQEVNK